MLLDKEKTLFQRGVNGNILPLTVEIDGDPQKRSIEIIPLSYLDVRNIFEKMDEKNNVPAEIQLEMIRKYIVNPLYSDIEIKTLTPIWVNRLFNTILMNSQITAKEEVGSEKKNSGTLKTEKDTDR